MASLCLPYSTSSVESLFSQFKAFKTCYRNRLGVANLEASLLTEQHFKKEEPRISNDMITRYYTMWQKTPEGNSTLNDEVQDEDSPKEQAPTTATNELYIKHF